MDISEHPRLYNATSKTSIQINNNPFTIGRGLNCDYIITNQVISRLHCQLEKNGNQWFLRDKSTNGTYVNGDVINSTLSGPLKDSDEIQLSQDNFKYYFQITPTDDISDEQLCMLADSVFENIEVNNPSASGCTSNNQIISISDSVDDEVISVSVESVEEAESPAILVTGAHPTKKIKIVDPSSSVVDLTGDISVDNAIPSTSSDTNKEPITINDSFQIVPSTTSDLKMVIQKVSIGKDPVKVKSEKASTSTAATMGQSVSQTREGNEYINDGQMDDELLCAICSEMFVKATTLNCSHTFCKYCIDTWKTKQTFCPICRSKITSQVPTLVLDNVIDKVIQSSSLDIQEHRKELLEERNNTVKKKSTKNNVEGVGIVVEVESTPVDSSSDTSTLSETSEDEEDWQMEYWNDDWYNRRAGAYYGGYGRCFTCGRRGHWANGCPNR